MALPQLRCVLVTIAPLLSSIVAATIARRFDMHLLENIHEREGLQARLLELNPDLVVIGLAPDESDQAAVELLTHLLKAKILLISSNGDCAYLHAMVPHREVLADFSPETLVAALL